jgi:hypothetical protein
MSFPQRIIAALSVAAAGLWAAPAPAVEYFVAPGGDDADPGTESQPFATLTHAIDQLADGDILTLRGGEYRLVDEDGPGFIDVPGITIQGHPGEAAVLLGSASTEGVTWEAYNANVWRISAGFLSRDPKGLFNGSRRIAHSTDFSNGRDHSDVSELTEPGLWTKADVNGEQCGDDNAGCYIYLYPPAGETPDEEIYELAQRGLARIVADHVTLRNLEFYYTQSSPVFFEGADYAVIEHSIFGHNSNGNDNSYGLRIWDSQGTIVRHNRVFDSVYWGGVSNSKGITFMVSKLGDPNIVEYNEIHDIPGFAAVGTKGGVSGLIVRHNYIHDVYAAIEPGDERCVWASDNPTCESSDEEYRPGGRWEIYGNVIVNAEIGVRLPGFTSDGHDNRVYNNVFHQGRTGIDLGWDGSYGNVFANNVFSANQAGIYLSSGGTDTAVPDYLDQFVSDNNLFFGNSLADIHLRPNWGGNYSSGTPYSLADFRNAFGREMDSIAGDRVSSMRPRTFTWMTTARLAPRAIAVSGRGCRRSISAPIPSAACCSSTPSSSRPPIDAGPGRAGASPGRAVRYSQPWSRAMR